MKKIYECHNMNKCLTFNVAGMSRQVACDFTERRSSTFLGRGKCPTTECYWSDKSFILDIIEQLF